MVSCKNQWRMGQLHSFCLRNLQDLGLNASIQCTINQYKEDDWESVDGVKARQPINGKLNWTRWKMTVKSKRIRKETNSFCHRRGDPENEKARIRIGRHVNKVFVSIFREFYRIQFILVFISNFINIF